MMKSPPERLLCALHPQSLSRIRSDAVTTAHAGGRALPRHLVPMRCPSTVNVAMVIRTGSCAARGRRTRIMISVGSGLDSLTWEYKSFPYDRVVLDGRNHQPFCCLAGDSTFQAATIRTLWASEIPCSGLSDNERVRPATTRSTT
jgi:hypothetical protein